MDYTFEYLPLRGISAETMRYYNIKTKVDQDGKPVSINFIYPNGDIQVRNLDKKEYFWETPNNSAKAGLFGRNLFATGSHKWVTITEGGLDAASLYQVLKCPVVSVHSASSAVSDCTVDRSWLNSFERIYLAFDGDTAGREAAGNVARLFDPGKLYQVKFTKRKDANEHLQYGERDELYNIWWNSKKYLPDNIISSLSDFNKILTEEIKYGVPYPFKTVNDKTYGIRTGESVLITAQEGIGKTELMHAIEYDLLKETSDNVGAIFLEEPQHRHLQSLAGIHLRRPVHLPDSGCTPDQISGALRELVKVDNRLYLYTYFGSDDPEKLLDTIRFLVSGCACRYILLDHISMVVSGLAEEDERRKLDYFSTKVEMMVKELNFSLIIVSHVNDMGQTRGSRYIGKVADIRIDATRDLLATNDSVRNTLVLNISKNRYSGRTGPAGMYLFDPLTRVYQELPHEQLVQDELSLPSPGMEVKGKEQKESIEIQIPIPSNDNSQTWPERRVA